MMPFKITTKRAPRLPLIITFLIIAMVGVAFATSSRAKSLIPIGQCGQATAKEDAADQATGEVWPAEVS